MTFGKFQGYDVSEIPYDYLLWVRTNVKIKSHKLRKEIEYRILDIVAEWQENDDYMKTVYGEEYEKHG